MQTNEPEFYQPPDVMNGLSGASPYQATASSHPGKGRYFPDNQKAPASTQSGTRPHILFVDHSTKDLSSIFHPPCFQAAKGGYCPGLCRLSERIYDTQV